MNKWLLPIFLILTSGFFSFAQKKAYDDPAITEINMLPSRANFIPHKNGIAASNSRSSQRQLSLNGDWDFQMLVGKENIPDKFYAPDYQTNSWTRIKVPSNWQREGHGFPVFSNSTLDMEPDEVGLYRTYFSVPENWKKSRTIIHFAGVKTAFHLYVNGKEVGYSEGAYLPSEFDITDMLKKGSNLLAVAVYRVADIQKIENFDTWRLSGIFRDVLLINRPNTFIEDFEIQSPAINNYQDGKWTVSAKINNRSKNKAENLSLCVQLRKKTDQRLICEKELKVPVLEGQKSLTLHFSEVIKNVETWNAETPHLYQTVLELREQEETLEGMAVNTGFRTVEVIDEQIKVNGKKIYFKGVNRHDWHQDMGRAVDRKLIRKELEMMKKHHINSFRTSHYPNDAYLYNLADEMGFYIMDEAAMETHWVTHAEKEEGFREAHVSRIQRLIERDKNHPSVIMWSLGNEFHMGPHTNAMYDYTLQRDPSRLIYCDGDPKREDLAVRPGAYKGIEGLKEAAKKHKPVVMKEYMHAAGNEMGLFAQLWDVIRDPEYKQLQGGFIWDFKDQAWTIRKKGQNPYYDWGEDAGVAPTGNDGFDGITNADMEETPKLLEVASVFQDIKVLPEHPAKGKFLLINRHSFTAMDAFHAQWTLQVNGINVYQKQLPQLHTKAGESSQLLIDVNSIANLYSKADDVQILFEFYNKTTGQKAAWDQISLQEGNLKVDFPKKGKVKLVQGDKSFTVYSGNSVYKFNGKLGRFISWKNHGQEMLDLTQGPKLNLWRATTDADNSNWGSLQGKYHRAWKLIGIDDPEFFEQKAKKVSLIEESSKKVVFDIKTELTVAKEVMAVVEFRYTFLPAGKLFLGVNFIPGEKMKQLAGLPRMGITTHFKETYQNIKWYGMGPHENYRDRIESTTVGNYQDSPEKMYVNYIPAQANGNRSEVRWMSIDNGTSGLKIRRLSERNSNENLENYLPNQKKYQQAASTNFEFTAIPYTEYELETTTHEKDLPQSERVILTIDSEHAGVASHPRPGRLPEHEVKSENKSFVFIFSEID